MSDHYKIGQKVEVAGKDVKGTIAFYGPTQFASGKWIGLILDEPKGKNNGTVRDCTYFQCEENYGMFVRVSQVIPLDEQGRRIEIKEKQMTEDSPAFKIRGRPSTSRISLASSRQSLTGSRNSLTGSRQSLSGSKSHLASSPSVEKLPEDETSQVPKRASFIETGFVETLRPQFTPGQALTSTPIMSVEEKLTNLQYHQEIENRNHQIKDLTERLETLKMKRQDDKERMKDYDKLKIQLEQLVEFKVKIMESQNSLQRELQKARQETKDAIEAKEIHAEEVADLADAVEMATVEKEMAEEKAETLQLELEVCKEKLEEVSLDLEILKAEMQNKTDGTSDASTVVSAFELKQLEQQNARLRETLVRMRDLSAHDKHEYQKLMKDLDQKKSEIAELGRTKEKLSSRVEAMEQQVSDLQEQVDAALGAEEMVVILGEQKLTLEEKVVKLEEEVAELEALQDMNDQLAESNAELEMDLREELDLAHAATREALREKEAAIETIADREATIGRFRELVNKLQEQLLELQHRLEKESNKPVSALPEMLDFKKMFTETKAHTKAIDLELRRIDVQQLEQHIKYLTSFMPDSFMSRGGDHDSILVLLLIPRLIHKSEILLGQIRDKFPTVDKIDRNTIIKGHSIEQFAFKCRISYYIYALQSILHQFLFSLNMCKPQYLLKVGAAYPEMVAQEKVIDGFVELLKRDQLDENVPTEILEKCVTYFYTVFPFLLPSDELQNHTLLLSDNTKVLLSACEEMNNAALAIRNLIESENVGDIGLLSQHVISVVEQLQQQLKLVKRRNPPDTNVSNIGLGKDIANNLYQCYNHAGKILKTLQDIIKNAVQNIITSSDPEKGLSSEKMKDLAINASDKIYEQDDLGPVQSIKNSLSFILTQVTQIAQFLQENEHEIHLANKNEKVTPPIHLRAQTVRKELEQIKTLANKLGNKESDIKELKKTIKEKQEQLSEMTIRKELAERKLGNVNKDYELTIEKLQRKCEEAQNNLKKKEKEFEDTLDHLQTDIDSLEIEKLKMKETLKLYKKALPEGVIGNVAGNHFNSMQSVGPSLPAIVKDSPLLLQEIENLRKLFHHEKDMRLKLQNNKLKEQLENLAPLPSFIEKRDPELDSLYIEGNKLKQEIILTLAKPQFPAVYKAKRGNSLSLWIKHFVDENYKKLDLKYRAQQFQVKITKALIGRQYGSYVEADFTVFPTAEMTKTLKESEAVNIGHVKIPKSCLSPNEKLEVRNVDLNLKTLQTLLHTISY